MNGQTRVMIQERASAAVVEQMSEGEAKNQAISLLSDYFEDIRRARIKGSWTDADLADYMDRIADVVTRLERS